MKTTIKSIFSLFLLLVLLTGCGKDNYDAPDSQLTGRVVYKGEPIQVRGSDERVRLQLYQDGYDYRTPIEVFVTQDGSFSALLFDGEYKMVTRDNNGPWVNSRDTTLVTVKGNTHVDMEVTPYFTISNADITLANNVITAKFDITRIVDTAEMDRVILLAGQTAFVDDDYKVLRVDWTDNLQTGTVTYTAELNDEAKEAIVLNGRVCVWTRGADQGIYSPIFKLK
ncbi:MAG: DUF3823 domain-containing protein [Tannerellaceae bacterium]|nr:DUF3823 domain-containing protein [Tannerellaceae bacterium]